MEITKLKTDIENNITNEDDGKAVRVSRKHHEILKNGRIEINKDTTYQRQISITRYLEKLIEDYWSKPIEELQKERVGSKDWLEVEHRRSGTELSLFDWLKHEYQGRQKKSLKANSKAKK